LNFNHEVRKNLSNYSIKFMQDQFKILFAAIDNISVDKKAGEMMTQENVQLKTLRKDHTDEISLLKS